MNAFNFGPSLSTITLYSFSFDSEKLFFWWVFATMIWFLQMNLLNIDRTFFCQREYGDHILPLYLQLCYQMIVLPDSPRCSEPFCSTYQSRARPYLITLPPVCIHSCFASATHDKPVYGSQLYLGLALRSRRRSMGHLSTNFYFPISSFKPWTATICLHSISESFILHK